MRIRPVLSLVLGASLITLVGSNAQKLHAIAQSGEMLAVRGRIFVRDGKRFRGDDRNRISLDSNIELFRIPFDRFGYLFQNDVCADQTVGNVYVEAQRVSNNGVIFLLGRAEMRYGACAVSHADFVKAKRFQCYVPPGLTTPRFTMRMTQNDQDDVVEVNLRVTNYDSRYYNGSPAQCQIFEHIN